LFVISKNKQIIKIEKVPYFAKYQHYFSMKNFSELTNTSLIPRDHHIREHTVVVTSKTITKINAESVFGVWIDSIFVDHVDVLESLVGLQEGLCLNAEPEQNRSQGSVQSSTIQQLSFYYLSRTTPLIRPESTLGITSNVSTIDFIFRGQAYYHNMYTFQRLIKSAFDRIHQIVIKCALCYSLTAAVLCLYYSHTILLILQL